jgi:hypothetical protein
VCGRPFFFSAAAFNSPPRGDGEASVSLLLLLKPTCPNTPIDEAPLSSQRIGLGVGTAALRFFSGGRSARAATHLCVWPNNTRRSQNEKPMNKRPNEMLFLGDQSFDVIGGSNCSTIKRWQLLNFGVCRAGVWLTHYPGRGVVHTHNPRHLNDVNYEKINTAAPFSVSYTHVRT